MTFLLILLARAHAVCATPAQLDTDMTAASLASVISLAGVNPLNCPEVTMAEAWSGGKLIFSDSPESPTAKGKLYKDTLAATSGTVYNRVYAYHVNASGSTKRFVVVLKNTSGSSATLTRQKQGVAGPTTSFAYAGKLAVQRWIDDGADAGTSVAAGATVSLDATFNGTNVSNGNLYHGIWDYSFPAAHEIHVCMLNTNDSATAVCPGQAVQARDSHDRGTFDYADKAYDTAVGVTIDVAAGIVQFPLAADTATDTDAHGWDNAVATPTEEYLDGNYGVLYKLHLSTVDNDGTQDNLGLCANPRGGSWAGAARVSAGVLPTTNTTTLLPAGTGSTSDSTKCTVTGRYTPGAGLTPWAQFMPSGGAALPVRVVAVGH
jgi:hypothetical protein